MKPPIINCTSLDWKSTLKSRLQKGVEVDLSNFEYTIDGALCEMLALSHGMVFKLDAKNRAGHFRKRD
jgi:hypothetical protein